MIDTHCHFDFSPFRDDPMQALAQAKQAGITQMVIPSVGQANWGAIQELCLSDPMLYYGLGIHPFFSADHPVDVSEQLNIALASAMSSPKTQCVAVGECGLDFAITSVDRAQQIDWLQAQCQLAHHYQLPVILHCRKAFPELLRTLKAQSLPQGGVYHGFSGSYQQAVQLLDIGIKIGVGGTITYARAQKTRETIRQLPLSAMVLETDAPDMPVYGFQGQPNRPERLTYIVQSIAEIRKDSISDIIDTTTETAKTLFKI